MTEDCKRVKCPGCGVWIYEDETHVCVNMQGVNVGTWDEYYSGDDRDQS